MKSDFETICTRNIRSLPLHLHEVGATEASTMALQEADVLSHEVWDIAATLRENYAKAIAFGADIIIVATTTKQNT